MLTYFGLIAAASLLITVEFVYAIQAATPGYEHGLQAGNVSDTSLAGLAETLNSLRNKAMLMCLVQAVVTLIVLIMFMRRITGPLQHMVEASLTISDGDLSRTIQVRTMDEIGLLGETINGLTSNIQELVAFGRSTVSDTRLDVESLREILGDNPDAQGHLEALESKLMGFDEIMCDFKLLTPDTSKDGAEA